MQSSSWEDEDAPHVLHAAIRNGDSGQSWVEYNVALGNSTEEANRLDTIHRGDSHKLNVFRYEINWPSSPSYQPPRNSKQVTTGSGKSTVGYVTALLGTMSTYELIHETR